MIRTFLIIKEGFCFTNGASTIKIHTSIFTLTQLYLKSLKFYLVVILNKVLI